MAAYLDIVTRATRRIAGLARLRSADGGRQLVPNHGLPAVTLILLLAFTLCSAFTLRHSKLFRRYRMTAIEVAHQLRRSLSKLPPTIRAPRLGTRVIAQPGPS